MMVGLSCNSLCFRWIPMRCCKITYFTIENDGEKNDI